MFGKNDKKVAPKKTTTGSTTLLAAGTEVLGDIRFSGNLEIEGCVTGNIVAAEGVDSAMRIMESGRVEGDVYVPNVVINGQVNGEVHASNYLELGSKAHVEGNVHYNLIEMVRGAQVNGSLIFNAAYAEDAPKNQAADAGDELKFGADIVTGLTDDKAGA